MIGTLYGGPFTLPAAIVRVVLADRELPFQFVEVPWSPEAGYTPFHPMIGKHHPDQKNPVWADPHVVLYDSFLICAYLEDRFDPVGTAHSAAVARAKSRALFRDADQHLFPLIEGLVQARIYERNSLHNNSPDIAGGLASFSDRMARAAELEHYELNALCPSTGDLAAATLLTGLAYLAGGLPGVSEDVQTWLQKMKQRPSLSSVFDEMVARTSQALPNVALTPH